MPDLVVWDVDRSTLLYVTTADQRELRIRDLDTGRESSHSLAEGRSVFAARIVEGGVAYLAAVGPERRRADEPYRPESFEVRLFRTSSATDALIEGLPVFLEPGVQGRSLLGPSLIASKDRRAFAWSRYLSEGETEVTTEVRQASADGGPLLTLDRGRGLIFPGVLAGAELVAWRRPLGAHDSPGSIETFVVSGGSERPLGKRAWNVDVSADGRAVVQLDASAELRDGILGPVVSRAALSGTPGPVAIAGKWLAWCSQEGTVSLLDLDTQTTRGFESPSCYPTLYLDDAALTWLQTAPGKYALVRLALP